MHKTIGMANKDNAKLNEPEGRDQQIPLDSGKCIKDLSVFTCKQRDVVDESVKLSKPIKKTVKRQIQNRSSQAYVKIKADNIGNFLESIISIASQEEKLVQKNNIKNRVIGLEIYEGINEIRVLCSTKLLAIQIASKLKNSQEL